MRGYSHVDGGHGGEHPRLGRDNRGGRSQVADDTGVLAGVMTGMTGDISAEKRVTFLSWHRVYGPAGTFTSEIHSGICRNLRGGSLKQSLHLAV